MGNSKQIVREGYDACGTTYNEARALDPSPELNCLLNELPPLARVLDIGCGGGVPVTAVLAERATVIGVDISEVQIAQARSQVPKATFILGDIMSQEFTPSFFDAIVAFYTIFHLPRAEHGLLFERIARWLRPGGYFLATLANTDHPGYTEPDFFGANMYWSHFNSEWYVSRLRELDFQIIRRGILGHGYRGIPGLPPERHPTVLAQLRGGRPNNSVEPAG